MGKDSGIQWTDHTFNPIWGCAKVSPGCTNCYAEAFAKRTGHKVWGEGGGRRTFGEKHWAEPLKWNAAAEKAGKRARVFCASMADVFEDHPVWETERPRLWYLIDSTPSLDWLLLTKRPENLSRWLPWVIGEDAPGSVVSDGHPWPNVWLGTTVEDQQRANERIPELLKVPAVVRFLSMEPLLESVDLRAFKDSFNDFLEVDWIIVGGESGAKARPFELSWARDLVRQAKNGGAAPFVKQLGTRPGEDRRCDVPACNCGGLHWQRLDLDDHHGGDMSEWPADLRVREFPEVRR